MYSELAQSLAFVRFHGFYDALLSKKNLYHRNDRTWNQGSPCFLVPWMCIGSKPWVKEKRLSVKKRSKENLIRKAGMSITKETTVGFKRNEAIFTVTPQNHSIRAFWLIRCVSAFFFLCVCVCVCVCVLFLGGGMWVWLPYRS